MSIDVKMIDRKMKKIQEQEQRIKLEKADLMKKKKEAKKYALQKLGEIFFHGFKIAKGEDITTSKNALLTSIEKSPLSDKEKKKLSDLIESGILNFERSSTSEEKVASVEDYQRNNSLR